MTADTLRTREADGEETDTPPSGFFGFRPAVLVAVAVLLLGAFAAGILVSGLPPDDSSAEAGFARDMGVHHAQAVDMAEIVRDRTSDPEVRYLAVDIALGQQAQIGQMQGWLAVWGLPATGSQPAMAWMGHMMPVASLMPGMATVDELALLRDAPPDKVDAMFLQLMIRHHRGGVDMAEAVLTRTRRPEVQRLAQAIVTGQLAEISAMNDLLRRKGAAVPSEASDGSMAMMGHAMKPGLINVDLGTFRDLLLYSPLALSTCAIAWLAVDAARRRAGVEMTASDYRRSEGLHSLAVGSLALGASFHVGLWPTYVVGLAGTAPLFGVVSIGMAAVGGAILARPTSLTCIAGAGLAMLATSAFVVLRLAPALAGTMPLLLEGAELVAVGVDLVTLLCCALLWQSRVDPQDTVERLDDQPVWSPGGRERPDVDGSVR